MPSSVPYAKVVKFLKQGKSFLITTHINPDGDGIGSMLALARALRKLRKKVLCFSNDPIPESLGFLPESENIVSKIPDRMEVDVCIMVDCAEPKRAGKAFAEFSKGRRIVVIDHHLYSNLDDATMCLDANAASAGEVVWKLISKMGVKRDTLIATCIYTTLVVDTGFFRYSNTTSHVLSLAGELIEAGAEPWLVAKNLDESYPLSRLKLLGRSLESLNVSFDGRYASMEVTDDMLGATGSSIADSDEFAGYPRSIKSVEIAALFRETGDGSVKVSLRSKDYVNVAEIARRHGGGGHKHAAGFTLKCSIRDAKKIMEGEVVKELGKSQVPSFKFQVPSSKK